MNGCTAPLDTIDATVRLHLSPSTTLMPPVTSATVHVTHCRPDREEDTIVLPMANPSTPDLSEAIQAVYHAGDSGPTSDPVRLNEQDKDLLLHRRPIRQSIPPAPICSDDGNHRCLDHMIQVVHRSPFVKPTPLPQTFAHADCLHRRRHQRQSPSSLHRDDSPTSFGRRHRQHRPPPTPAAPPATSCNSPQACRRHRHHRGMITGVPR
ncbi:hypothetical protein ACLOJK_029488 [Asimina triloba]